LDDGIVQPFEISRMNSARLYVGNLPFGVSEQSLREAFEQHGSVVEVAIVKDRETGQPRGFGFVTMGSPNDAKNAAAKLDGAELGGRALRVNEAEARPSRDGYGRTGGRNRR
jgi:RNA recognition motif-containing protein